LAPAASPTEFVDLLRRSQLLNARFIERVGQQVESLHGAATGDGVEGARRLASGLVRRNVISMYQAQQLLAGRYKGFYLGKYKLLEILGRGGMGKVYLAEQVSMQRLVAVKIVRTARKGKSDVLQRFAREARAVAALNHQNIIRAYDYDDTGDTPFIVMEFVEGIDVQRQVGKCGPLSAGQAAEYVRQAAAGLHHAFQSGLVHRDIKPGNLLVDTSGVVKLLDLGLVGIDDDQAGDGLTNDAEPLGTVDYVAPEQAAHSSTADIRADIYSLGAVLHFMLTGKILFPDRSTSEKLVALQTQPPVPTAELAPGLPAGLPEIIDRMIAKKPTERYQTPADVLAAITPFAMPVHPPYDLTAVRHPREQMRALLRRSPPINDIGDPAVQASLAASQPEASDSNKGSGKHNSSSPVISQQPADAAPLADDEQTAAGEAADEQHEIDTLISLLLDEEDQADEHDPQSHAGLSTGSYSAAEGVASDFKLALQSKTRNRAPSPTIRPSEDGPVTEKIYDGDSLAGRNLSAPVATQRPQNWKVAMLATVLVGGTSLAVCVASVLFISNWISSLAPPAAPANTRLPAGVTFPPEESSATGARPVDTPTAAVKPPEVVAAPRQQNPAELAPPAGAAQNLHAAAVVDGVFGDARLQHFNRVTALAATTDGARLATASADKTIRISTAKGEILHTLRWGGATGTALQFSPDGALLTGGDQDGLLTAWTTSSGKISWQHEAGGSVTSISFTSDGRFFAASNSSKTARVYETRSGSPRTDFEYPLPPACLAFSADNERLAAMLEDGRVIVRDVRSGTTLLETAPHDGDARCLAFGPAGNLAAIASEEKAMYIWPAAVFADEKNRLSADAVKDLTRRITLPAKPQTLLWRGAGRLAVACGSGVFTFTINDNLAEQSSAGTLWGHRGSITGLAAMSSSGDAFVSSDSEGGVLTWKDTDERADQAGWPGNAISCFAFSPLNGSLFTGQFNHIQQRSLVSQKTVSAFGRFPGFAHALSLSSNGKLLAGCGQYQPLAQVWDTRTGWQYARLQSSDRIVSISSGATGEALSIAVHKNGCSLYHTATGRLLVDYGGSDAGVRSISTSHEGRWLAACSQKNAAVWNARTGSRELLLPGGDAPLRVCRFSPVSNLLAAGGDGGAVHLWSVPGGEKVADLTVEAPSDVQAIAFDGSGKHLAVCGGSPVVSVWNIEHRKRIARFSLGPPGAKMHQVAFNAAGDRLLVLAGNGVVYRVLIDAEQSDRNVSSAAAGAGQ